MNKLFIFAAAAMTALILASCGGKNRSSETDMLMEQQTSQLTEALNARDYAAASSLADSMALYVDDLTPDETVTVLIAFLEIHNKAAEDNRRTDDLETLRKYVDVYDIATSANPQDMRAAFAAARKRNPQLDFEQAAQDFRRALAEYDAVRTYGEEPQPQAAQADSTAAAAADSVATSPKSTLNVD